MMAQSYAQTHWFFLLQSIFNMIPTDDQKNLPEDENTPEKRAEKIWSFFGKQENGKILNSFTKKEKKQKLVPVKNTLYFFSVSHFQIKSLRASSFRVWWTTRTSFAWYNTTNLRKSKTSWKRRSSSIALIVVLRLFSFHVYILLSSDCLSAWPSFLFHLVAVQIFFFLSLHPG